MCVVNHNYIINSVFKDQNIREIIFLYQKRYLEDDKIQYNERVNETENNKITKKIGELNIGERFSIVNYRFTDSNIYEVVKLTSRSVFYCKVDMVIQETIKGNIQGMSHKKVYYKCVDGLDTKKKIKRRNTDVYYFKNQDMEIWKQDSIQLDIRPGYYCEDNLWYKNGSGVCAPIEW